MKTEPEKTKKKWFSPQLVVHGDVEEITKGKGKVPGTHDAHNVQFPPHGLGS